MRNKNNIRKTADTYQDYLSKREGFDPFSLENISDIESPYHVKPLPPVLEDLYETLENMYANGRFKGRQKQIIKLLLEGETNQTTIAKRLNMKQSNVSVEIQKVREKLLANII